MRTLSFEEIKTNGVERSWQRRQIVITTYKWYKLTNKWFKQQTIVFKNILTLIL